MKMENGLEMNLSEFRNFWQLHEALKGAVDYFDTGVELHSAPTAVGKTLATIYTEVTLSVTRLSQQYIALDDYGSLNKKLGKAATSIKRGSTAYPLLQSDYFYDVLDAADDMGFALDAEDTDECVQSICNLMDAMQYLADYLEMDIHGDIEMAAVIRLAPVDNVVDTSTYFVGYTIDGGLLTTNDPINAALFLSDDSVSRTQALIEALTDLGTEALDFPELCHIQVEDKSKWIARWATAPSDYRPTTAELPPEIEGGEWNALLEDIAARPSNE